LTRQYGKSANAELRRYWKFFRGFSRYGFGYIECVPIRSVVEAVAEYVSKYLSKAERPLEYKGCRMHQALKHKPSMSSRYSWRIEGYYKRRAYEQVAADLGIYDPDAFWQRMKWDYGSKWAYNLREYFSSVANELQKDYDESRKK